MGTQRKPRRGNNESTDRSLQFEPFIIERGCDRCHLLSSRASPDAGIRSIGDT
jgi:hypothetical protein